MALLILGNMGLGYYAHGLPLSPDKLKLFLWHKSLGITVLALAVIRLVWAVFQRRPEWPSSMARWQQIGARISHVALYLLMFAVPTSGWLLNSAANVPLRYFGWFTLPNLIGGDEAKKALFSSIHEYLFWALLALVVLHLLAALKHQFIDKDGMLRKMLPGGK